MLTRTMKEPANTWTHFIPFLASGAGLLFLSLNAKNDLSKLTVMLVYAFSVTLLYGASSLYHWRRTTAERELMLRKIDHMTIYVLIAGSYTPVLYYGLSGAWRWSMLGDGLGISSFGHDIEDLVCRCTEMGNNSFLSGFRMDRCHSFLSTCAYPAFRCSYTYGTGRFSLYVWRRDLWNESF